MMKILAHLQQRHNNMAPNKFHMILVLCAFIPILLVDHHNYLMIVVVASLISFILGELVPDEGILHKWWHWALFIVLLAVAVVTLY